MNNDNLLSIIEQTIELNAFLELFDQKVNTIVSTGKTVTNDEANLVMHNVSLLRRLTAELEERLSDELTDRDGGDRQ